MACIYGDQPLRIQKAKDGVIHAGSYQDYGGFTSMVYNRETGRSENKFIPKRKRISIVCSRYSRDDTVESDLVENTHSITCKSCLKLMGLIDDSENAKRFVIVSKETGEFYKNTSTRCSVWSESIYEAFFFKRKGTAEAKCMSWVYIVDGKILKYREWQAAGRPKATHTRLPDPNMEVKMVKIMVE
jgi:hypothetical protein